MDRRILEYMAQTRDLKFGGMWLRPHGLARNLGTSREYVNRRLIELTDRGYVETDGEGYYRITDEGVDFVRG